MARKTTLEKIDVIVGKIKILEGKIAALRNSCPHPSIKVDRQIVGFNGYGNDYTTYCRCELCNQSWFHDGYCTGETHTKRSV